MACCGQRVHRIERLVSSFESNAELSNQLASCIASNLAAALKRRAHATLAVSGGSTPQPLFEMLSRKPLDWSRIIITSVDERWVEETHVDSNARLINQFLLQNSAKAAQFISMKTPSDSPFQAEVAASAKLSPYASGIDVVVLGMGEDGHTASFSRGADPGSGHESRYYPIVCCGASTGRGTR